MKKEKREKDYKKVVDVLSKPSKTDPQGSYTGVNWNKGERPVQDADDLWTNKDGSCSISAAVLLPDKTIHSIVNKIIFRAAIWYDIRKKFHKIILN